MCELCATLLQIGSYWKNVPKINGMSAKYLVPHVPGRVKKKESILSLNARSGQVANFDPHMGQQREGWYRAHAPSSHQSEGCSNLIAKS